MAMEYSLVPRDDQAKFQEFYQLYSLCTNDFCPDSYYDYTDHCTVEKCPIDSSNYNYLPSLPVNAVFLTLFSISLVCYLGQGFLSRRFIGFTIAMVCGNILEVLGYIGRIMSHNDPWDQNGFLLQIICLTIAPAFFAAGIYLTLTRIVMTVGESNSRIKPKSFPRFFIPCDIISLVLQAIGGGMASVASNNHESPETGDHIMVAGLSFQVATLAIFILICADFAVSTMRNAHADGAADDALESTNHAQLRGSIKFQGFLVALAIATLCIFIRSIYRVIELAQGWGGELIKNQTYFIVLEGAMVIVAVLALNGFHPGWCFQEGYHESVTSALKNKGQVQNDEKHQMRWTMRGRK